jgi:RNA polymerase sigma-70 factor (ECF subfamily)
VTELLEQWLSRVYRFALRLAGDPHAAEDLTQETMLRAWPRLGRLREPHAFRVWLFRITANLWRDQLRRRRDIQPIGKDQPEGSPGLEQRAVQQEDLHRALAAMDALPSRQREVLYLNACEQLSLGEIAEILSISPAAVRSSLSLARKKLREELADIWSEPTKPSVPDD